MPSSENVLQPATLRNRPASRYEALSRLAEVIRSRPDEKDLFQTLANELHEVVEFDAIWQLDATANWIQWHLVEPFDQRLNAIHLQPVTKEETVSWWVYENQQPVVLRLSDPDSRFPQMRDRLAKLGLKSSCALPLSTAQPAPGADPPLVDRLGEARRGQGNGGADGIALNELRTGKR